MKATIQEISTTMMEIRIDIQWMQLGRDTAYRYAERLAEAFSLGSNWEAIQGRPTDDGQEFEVRMRKAPR